MQIAPVASTLLSVPSIAPSRPAAPVGAPARRFEQVFDFPTLAAGDAFRIARGSTFNGIGVRGSARLDALTPNAAEIWIKAGTFGISREATIGVTQTGPTTASITVAVPGSEPVTIAADVVDARRDYSEFASSDPSVTGAAKLQVDADGRFIVDVEGAMLAGLLGIDARVHLVLERA